MKPVKFDKIAREAFADALQDAGFTVRDSKLCTFHRQASTDIWHFVMPDPSRSGSWYDIKVFATSPRIEPLFEELFPDAFGIPSDVASYLHPVKGVGMRQYQYHCRTPEGFSRNFEQLVRPALKAAALPYLDGIDSLQALVPYIRHKLYLGIALHEIGQKEAALPILLAEKARLEAIGGVDRADRKVVAFLARLKALTT